MKFIERIAHLNGIRPGDFIATFEIRRARSLLLTAAGRGKTFHVPRKSAEPVLRGSLFECSREQHIAMTAEQSPLDVWSTVCFGNEDD